MSVSGFEKEAQDNSEMAGANSQKSTTKIPILHSLFNSLFIIQFIIHYLK